MEDIYDNLDNYCYEEVQTENEGLKNKIKDISSKLSQVQEDYDNLKKEFSKLETHYSSLLKTAKAEIQRKTQIISKLNTEKDQLIINHVTNSRPRYPFGPRHNNFKDKQKDNLKKNVNDDKTTKEEDVSGAHIDKKQVCIQQNKDPRQEPKRLLPTSDNSDPKCKANKGDNLLKDTINTTEADKNKKHVTGLYSVVAKENLIKEEQKHKTNVDNIEVDPRLEKKYSRRKSVEESRKTTQCMSDGEIVDDETSSTNSVKSHDKYKRQGSTGESRKRSDSPSDNYGARKSSNTYNRSRHSKYIDNNEDRNNHKYFNQRQKRSKSRRDHSRDNYDHERFYRQANDRHTYTRTVRGGVFNRLGHERLVSERGYNRHTLDLKRDLNSPECDKYNRSKSRDNRAHHMNDGYNRNKEPTYENRPTKHKLTAEFDECGKTKRTKPEDKKEEEEEKKKDPFENTLFQKIDVKHNTVNPLESKPSCNNKNIVDPQEVAEFTPQLLEDSSLNSGTFPQLNRKGCVDPEEVKMVYMDIDREVGNLSAERGKGPEKSNESNDMSSNKDVAAKETSTLLNNNKKDIKRVRPTYLPPSQSQDTRGLLKVFGKYNISKISNDNEENTKNNITNKIGADSNESKKKLVIKRGIDTKEVNKNKKLPIIHPIPNLKFNENVKVIAVNQPLLPQNTCKKINYKIPRHSKTSKDVSAPSKQQIIAEDLALSDDNSNDIINNSKEIPVLKGSFSSSAKKQVEKKEVTPKDNISNKSKFSKASNIKDKFTDLFGETSLITPEDLELGNKPKHIEIDKNDIKEHNILSETNLNFENICEKKSKDKCETETSLISGSQTIDQPLKKCLDTIDLKYDTHIKESTLFGENTKHENNLNEPRKNTINYKKSLITKNILEQKNKSTTLINIPKPIIDSTTTNNNLEQTNRSLTPINITDNTNKVTDKYDLNHDNKCIALRNIPKEMTYGVIIEHNNESNILTNRVEQIAEKTHYVTPKHNLLKAPINPKQITDNTKNGTTKQKLKDDDSRVSVNITQKEIKDNSNHETNEHIYKSSTPIAQLLSESKFDIEELELEHSDDSRAPINLHQKLSDDCSKQNNATTNIYIAQKLPDNTNSKTTEHNFEQYDETAINVPQVLIDNTENKKLNKSLAANTSGQMSEYSNSLTDKKYLENNEAISETVPEQLTDDINLDAATSIVQPTRSDPVSDVTKQESIAPRKPADVTIVVKRRRRMIKNPAPAGS